MPKSPAWNVIGIKWLISFMPMLFLLSILPTNAEAIPAFARKYDLSCTSCHTKAPRLNAFGEAFHMAGYQIPQTEEGELREKRQIGRIVSEKTFLNIFALRATGNFVESISGGHPPETNLALPREIELYFAGTFTEDVSYFFNLSHEADTIEGIDNGRFEKTTAFGLGKEFFLMFDLSPSHRGATNMHEITMTGPMRMGPMIMVGKVDPSTNFSYPTNRQFILDQPGRIDTNNGTIQRFTLSPYAFSAKFFGLSTGEGNTIEVTKGVLYNTPGDFGIDVHAMLGRFMLQTGVMQGIDAGSADINEKKDPYVMTRVNFGSRNYFSGSASALAYWGNDTAKVGNDLVDWFRTGVSGNIKYKLLDLYGALIWDKISGLPAATASVFDETAFGMTLESDFILTDRYLLSLRYDRMDAGGFANQKADGEVLTLQLRKYFRDNYAVYLRDSVNIGRVSTNPLQNFRNLIALGVDLDF